MRPQTWQLGFVDDERQRSVVRAREHEATVSGGDDEVVVLPLRTGEQSFFGLLGAASLERSYAVVGQRNKPA